MDSHDKKFSEKFYNKGTVLMAPHIFMPASRILDLEEATDIFAKGTRIAFRMRRSDAMPFKDQFTLRSRTMYGQQNEISKIASGCADYYFYGIANRAETQIDVWHLFDCDLMREVLRCPDSKGLRVTDKRNSDGTWFRAYKIKEFNQIAPGFVVASSSSEAMGFPIKKPLFQPLLPDLFDVAF